jgi:mono/diheme cytochrome c family protein
MKFYQAVATCGCAIAGWWIIRAFQAEPVFFLEGRIEETGMCGNVFIESKDSYQPPANGIDGKALFQSNCASCHNPLKDATGPALKGAPDRVPSRTWLYAWVRNSDSLIRRGDIYAVKIFEQWGKTQMTAFPQLTDAEIDAIFSYASFVDPPESVY